MERNREKKKKSRVHEKKGGRGYVFKEPHFCCLCLGDRTGVSRKGGREGVRDGMLMTIFVDECRRGSLRGDKGDDSLNLILAFPFILGVCVCEACADGGTSCRVKEIMHWRKEIEIAQGRDECPDGAYGPALCIYNILCEKVKRKGGEEGGGRGGGWGKCFGTPLTPFRLEHIPLELRNV